MSKNVYTNRKRSLESLKANNLAAVLLTFYTWGPHGARNSCSAVRGPPHGQPIIPRGKVVVGVQDKAPLPGAGSSPAHCSSRQQHRRAQAGSSFHHSLSASRYRLFRAVSAEQSQACSSFIQLRALHRAAMMEKMNQPDILLYQRGPPAKPLNPALHSWEVNCSEWTWNISISGGKAPKRCPQGTNMEVSSVNMFKCCFISELSL